MGTIEDKAQEYVHEGTLYDVFVEGAEAQKKELLEWHNPAEKPLDSSEVLTKFIYNKTRVIYDASTYKSGRFSTCFPYFDIDGYKFIGWRYIQEL